MAFITFEGVEKCGKGTQVRLLYDYLERQGRDVLQTQEPGGTDVGQAIRDILLDPTFKEMDARTETLLFSASRAEHVERVLKPALAEGRIVLCDRFADSSLAYQSFGRGLPFDEVKRLNDWTTGGLEPDLTVLLRLPVEVAMQRLRQAAQDRIERADEEFHRRVAKGFDELSRMHPDRWRVVDGTKEKETIHREIVQLVEEIL